MRSATLPTRSLADQLGIWTSTLCVLHCLLTPVLLSLSSVFAHVLPGEEFTHRVLAVLVACFGTLALFRGFRQHRRFVVFLLMLCGLGCIAGAAWLGDLLPAHGFEVAITFVGSALMIAAHRLNHTFCNHCARTAGC